MSAPQLWVLLEIRRKLRFDQIAALSLAFSCGLVGAICLYVAIDQWLLGNAFWSAVNTAIAFFNSYTFDTNMRIFLASRFIDKRVRAMIQQRPGE